MISLTMVIVLQAAVPSDPKQSVDAAMARAHLVSDQMFSCMDAAAKAELKAQFSTATSASVEEAAFAKCAHLQDAYAVAVRGEYIGVGASKDLAAKWAASIREAYVKQVDKMLSRPEIAATRSKYVASEWSSCVRAKAEDWSRLSDAAATVAQAAVSACRAHEINLRAAVATEFRLKKLPVSSASDVVADVRETMVQNAIETIISERAKRLPKGK